MKNLRTRFPLLAILVLAAASAVAQTPAAYPEDVRQALQQAMRDATESLRASRIPAAQPVSTLPIGNDSAGYVEALLKIAVTDSGRTYVEGKTDPFWNEVLKEVAWDERKADMLDAETLVTFGKLKASQILIYGNVRTAEVSNRRVFVELELHASSIITKQHLWGGIFAKRFYLPGDNSPEGISAITAEVREPMRRMLAEQAMASLRGQEKLKAMRNVAFVPLAGDLDKYATFILRDAVSQTSLNPKDLDIGTLGEARLLLRDQPQQADALLYGALRDVSRRIVGRTPRSITYEVRTEVQACIENAATREQLWSASLFGKAEYTDTLTWWQWITEDAIPYLQAHPLVWIIPLALIVILIILHKITRAATRVR
jgi:hypothetical protein